MTALTTYLADAYLNHLLRGAAFPAPATLYVGLSSTATTDAGAYTEPSGNGYARVAIPCTAGQWSVPATASTVRQVTNVNPVAFPTASGGNWGTLSHCFIADAASGGNVLYHGPITGGGPTVNNGNAYAMAAGQLAPGLTITNLTTWLCDQLLNHTFRGVAFSLPATLYFGLSSTATTSAGAYTEPSGGSYARPSIDCTAGNWSAPATNGGNRQSANVNAIATPYATADWPATAHGFLADAASGGNVYAHGALSSSVTVLNTQNMALDPGAFTVNLT